MMNAFLQDLRYAARNLRTSPGWNAIVVLTLGLGIGAVVAIFSVARGVLIERLPYREPERLVRIGHVSRESVNPGASFSPQDFEDLQAAAPGLSSVAAWSYDPSQSAKTLTGGGEPERVATAEVSGSFFDTLGREPLVGRGLTRDDDRAGRNLVAVLSERLWKRHFGGDRAIVGRPVTLSGQPFTVVGVMPADFELPAAEVDLWLPLSTVTEDMVPHRREVRWMNVLGRLAPDATETSTRAGLDAFFERLARQYPDSNAGFEKASVVSLEDSVTGDVRKPIWILLGAVSLVLLIGCVNVANLLLARAAGRRREIGIRAALGASRGRLIGQLLTESVLLSLTGGLLGLLLARWGIDALAAAVERSVPRASAIRMDPAIVAFAVGLSILTGVGFGLLPAIRGSRLNLHQALEGFGSRGGTQDRTGTALRRSLVVGEMTLAVALLVGSGLLLRSFWRLTHGDPGFRADSVLTVSIVVPDDLYAQEKDGPYRDAMLANLRAIPGVLAAGGSKTLPLRGGGEHYKFAVDARPDMKPFAPDGGVTIVMPGYFSALRIPILRGRAFDQTDMDTARPVLIVNRSLARSLWGDADPIGKTLSIGDTHFDVVGLAGDVRIEGLDRRPPAAVYVPEARFPRGTMKVFLRTDGDPTALAPAVRAAIHRVDPNQPITALVPLTDVVWSTVARPRFLTELVGLFGAAALLLAAVGVYGVISFSVARRTREIGLRMALGADRAAVRRLVVGEGMRLAVAGLAIGIPTALVASRTLRSLLFEIPPGDPVTLAGVVALLAMVAFAACAIPARRASLLDPQAALREDA
jgi:predicted permease